MPTTAQVLPPPLREGDRLSTDEFLRRWDAMPDVNRAELIEGIVHMPSPLMNLHGVCQFRLSAWLTYYLTAVPTCDAVDSATWKMSDGNLPQPDLALRIRPEHGGQSTVEGGYCKGAPELVIEVSVATTARDAGVKLSLYELSGVREYLIVRPQKKQLTWRELVEGKYREIEPDSDGVIRSQVFPGLWLNPAALWNNDLPGMAATVQQGLAHSAHS